MFDFLSVYKMYDEGQITFEELRDKVASELARITTPEDFGYAIQAVADAHLYRN